MKKSTKFSPEVRERAVRMVQEHRGEYPSLWAAIQSIAPKIGCVPQTLNEWVRKQRDFVEGVQLLIAKLEEISQLKDFGSDFWKETRSKMEESVGILKNGSQEIENQLTNLDERFYQRLNATLAQLDACIQSMVKASGYKPSGSGRNPIGF